MPTSGQGSSGKGGGPTQTPAAGASTTQDATKARQEQAKAAQPTAQVDPKAQAVALRAAGVQPGEGTAAAHAAAGSPEGEETAGDQPQTSDEAGDPPAAVITASGQIPHGFVPSPSGPVPAATIADPVAAQKAQDAALLAAHSHTQRGLSGHRKLTREQLAGMPRASIRAVAADRGYDLGEGGRRVSIDRFLKEQDEDELVMEDDEVAAQLRTAQTTPILPGGTPPAAASGGGATGVAPGKAAEAQQQVEQDLASGEVKPPVTTRTTQ